MTSELLDKDDIENTDIPNCFEEPSDKKCGIDCFCEDMDDMDIH